MICIIYVSVAVVALEKADVTVYRSDFLERSSVLYPSRSMGKVPELQPDRQFKYHLYDGCLNLDESDIGGEGELQILDEIARPIQFSASRILEGYQPHNTTFKVKIASPYLPHDLFGQDAVLCISRWARDISRDPRTHEIIACFPSTPNQQQY